MPLNPETFVASPPLRSLWRTDASLTAAVPGNQSLYGIRGSGNLVALRASDGTQRWELAGTYLPTQLVRQGNRLFAFRQGQGLAFIDDAGNSAVERLAISFGAAPETNISGPLVDDRRLYLAVNQGLYVIHQDDGLQYAQVLEGNQPFTVCLAGPRDVIIVNGRGVPARFRVGGQAMELVWSGQPHGLGVGLDTRPMTVAGNRLVIGLDSYTLAYDLDTGRVAWTLYNSPSRSFAVQGDYVYAAFQGASISAIRATDGAVAWHRQFLYDLSVQGPYGLIMAGDYLYFGSTLQSNPDGTLLMGVKASDGAFSWLSRSVSLPWAGGIPTSDGDRIYVYGGAHTGAYEGLSATPQLGPQNVQITPRPIRGATAQFGAGHIQVTLPSAARVSLAPYREGRGLGTVAVSRANWSAGNHEASWVVSGSGGFTDLSQFGYMLMDVEEPAGLSYTQAMILPVNAFPDIMGHWAQSSIETMVYYRYVSGYPDQLFEPDNLVTRAESSTIIAKTLDLAGPSPGFQSKLTDISFHWARNYIMALEERGIVGGFAEPDGSFTFRPDLNMTRAQEATILVKAYSIPAAAPDFSTRFTDIAGHWASGAIKALESAGYVQGFQEADGTYTYRPEQNLTRAEMCVIIVRIRNLRR